MIINHNMSAIFALRQNKVNNLNLDKNIEKLSSGLRITRAGDDASGLAVSEKMRSQIRGLKQAQRNAENGISFIQSTEGYLQESQDIIQRLRELAVQSANGIYTDEDRMQIQVEVSQLIDEVDRIASHAQFNGMNILTGRFANEGGENVVTASMWLHIGANMDQRERVYIGTMTSESLGIRSVGTGEILSISTPDGPNRSIDLLDNPGIDFEGYCLPKSLDLKYQFSSSLVVLNDALDALERATDDSTSAALRQFQIPSKVSSHVQCFVYLP